MSSMVFVGRQWEHALMIAREDQKRVPHHAVKCAAGIRASNRACLAQSARVAIMA